MSDLLRNCDLPPPQKFLFSFDKDEKNNFLQPPPTSQPLGKTKTWVDELGVTKGNINLWTDEPTPERGDSGGDLLRALHLSQTRAREAEAKASSLTSTSKTIESLFWEGSFKLMGHQHLVRLLQARIAHLENHDKDKSVVGPDEDKDFGTAGFCTDAAAWCFALAALCLGVAAIGYTYVF